MGNKCCPICRSSEIKSRYSSIQNTETISVDDFKITDAGYGKTGPIYQCGSCGFIFVLFPQKNILEYYDSMSDKEYEEGREYRTKQHKRLLERLHANFPRIKTILDVGAGTGMLIQEGKKQGFEVAGIEPSQWAVEVAQNHGLKVFKGILPHPELEHLHFDAITLIDVIEHVIDPINILNNCHSLLREDGKLLLVTPDVKSVVARILGNKWWHYRIAHVGYFSVKTITLALEKAGFEVIKIRRPSWYFEISYLFERLRQYIPFPSLKNIDSKFSNWIFSMQIPANFFDSLEITASKN